MNQPIQNPDDRRHESDREDIMREATAMRRRASWTVEGLPGPIVAGFRSNDFFSIFFDQNPVYQFNSTGQLRRAYRDGLLYRTQGTTLARLNRVRTPDRTELQRTDLTPEELNEFLSEMRRWLNDFQSALENKDAKLQEQIPKASDIVPSVLAALLLIGKQTEPLAPALPTRRH
ncbi:MAG: hypothetical protein AB8G99_17485 [Planctomycetaceae bacterium]